MGAHMPDLEPVENASAEGLLSSLTTIDPAERRKHASVFNYWLSIRGPRQFPPIRDFDPLEISDAGPWSLLLEMIGGGEDAVIRHFGQAIRGAIKVDRIADAPDPSLLACIHAKLPLVAACREAFAFEESFETPDGSRRCWVTLLPFSENGNWVDYVYGYVGLDDATDKGEPTDTKPQAPGVAGGSEAPETAMEEETVARAPDPFVVPLGPLDEDPEEMEVATAPEPEPECEPETDPLAEAAAASVPESEPEPELAAEAAPATEFAPAPEAYPRPSFSAKVMESLASVGGLYGKVTQPEPEPELSPLALTEEESFEPAPPAEPFLESATIPEGNLQNMLSDVRALANEAREAQIRSEIALYEGLGAAYDFALAAEAEPEEYLRLVEGQGLKIQLRSPMKPVVRLAFDGTCDDPTIAQLEAVLAWALKQDLGKGTLAERIQAEGGIDAILGGQAAA